jgi:hypothetical protein
LLFDLVNTGYHHHRHHYRRRRRRRPFFLGRTHYLSADSNVIFSDITSEFRSVAMFIIDDLQTVFRTDSIPGILGCDAV